MSQEEEVGVVVGATPVCQVDVRVADEIGGVWKLCQSSLKNGTDQTESRKYKNQKFKIKTQEDIREVTISDINTLFPPFVF